MPTFGVFVFFHAILHGENRSGERVVVYKYVAQTGLVVGHLTCHTCSIPVSVLYSNVVQQC